MTKKNVLIVCKQQVNPRSPQNVSLSCSNYDDDHDDDDDHGMVEEVNRIYIRIRVELYPHKINIFVV